MELVSGREQTVRLAGLPWRFAAGEPLVTEHSQKYAPEAFDRLAERAGWRPTQAWSDPAGDLSLRLLVAAAATQADSGETQAGEPRA
jgi:uncharacterized SAM-dependent methyltransferase